MASRTLKEDDPLDDFEHRQIVLDGISKVVHVAGRGPAVIVMSEIPGNVNSSSARSCFLRLAGIMMPMPLSLMCPTRVVP